MLFQPQSINETRRFWLKVALACLILGSLTITLLVIGGRNSLSSSGLLLYNIGSNFVIMDTERHTTLSLSPDYRPYQDFYGWDRQSHFAFLSDRDGNTEVYIWDGLNYTNISQHPFNDWRPAMNPDGRVAFASERDGNMEIYVWDRGQLTNVSQNPASDDYPAWSDDGRLAWVSNQDGDLDIYVWDGAGARDVSQNSAVDLSPAWSRDGRLAWISGTGADKKIQLWDGSNITDVAGGSELRHLAWSSDGKLAFEILQDVYVWDGQNTINVSENRYSSDIDPTWSPDGRLTFVSLRNGHPDLYIWDGTSITPLTDDDIFESGPVWMP